MENTKIIGYISSDYFRERSISEMQDQSDPLMLLLWEFVVKLLKSETEEVKFFCYNNSPYPEDGDDLFEVVFHDPLSAFQWDGDTPEKKAQIVINTIMNFCKRIDDNNLMFGRAFDELNNDKLHTIEAKKSLFALTSCLFYSLRVNIDADITGVNQFLVQYTDYLENYVNEDNINSTWACFLYLYEERDIQRFVVNDTFFYRKRQQEQTKVKKQPKPEKPVRTFGLGEKVTVALLMKLESRLGTTSLNTNERASIYSAITGFSKDKIYTLLSGNFDLLESYHLEDVEKANKILNKLGIKRMITIDRKTKK